MSALNLPQLELDLIDILIGQGLSVQEIRLIGLLGEGTRASVYSVMLDGVYHVLKVYDSRESLRAELRHLRRMIPKDRFLFWWEAKVDGHNINLAISEVPEGTNFTSAKLTEQTGEVLALKMAELHRIRYRQKVSVTSLRDQLERYSELFLKHIEVLGRDLAPYEALVDRLRQQLTTNDELFRTNKVRVHGDMWWPNIIVAKEDVYLIDWESVRRGDAAEDIAKLRIFLYGARRGLAYFWNDPADGPKLAKLMQQIVQVHGDVTGDLNLIERLKYFLPYMCIHELGGRYVSGLTSQAMNQIVADEALRLADDPLGPPPDLKLYGYWDEIQARRLDTPKPYAL